MRRPHQKSKTGCFQCRQRRIKCPGGTPICEQCRRHTLDCKYPSTKQSQTQSSLAATKALSTTESFLNPYNLNSTSKVLDVNLTDLELLHVYSNTTFKSFAASRGHIWQHQVPQLAFRSPYLMHGLLATTAIHLSTFQPSRRDQLLEIAVGHEAMALPYYRKATEALDPANCESIFIFAAFVVAYAAAMPSAEDLRLPPRWLMLLRSSLMLLSSIWPWMESGPMAPLHKGPSTRAAEHQDPNAAYFDDLSVMLYTLDSGILEDDSDIEVYQATLDTLRWSSFLMSQKGSTLCNQAAAYVWPRFAPQRYFELLHEERPKALILLAYYCAQLHAAEFSWYFKGQSRSMLDQIKKALPLSMQGWLQWPMHQIMFGGSRSTCGGSGSPSGHGESQCTDFLLFYSARWEAISPL